MGAVADGELLTEDVGWFRVDGHGPAGPARRAAVAELTSNLATHAVDGAILVRRMRQHGIGGIELVAVDSGPGMADLDRSRRDGHSTWSGTRCTPRRSWRRSGTRCGRTSRRGIPPRRSPTG